MRYLAVLCKTLGPGLRRDDDVDTDLIQCVPFSAVQLVSDRTVVRGRVEPGVSINLGVCLAHARYFDKDTSIYRHGLPYK